MKKSSRTCSELGLLLSPQNDLLFGVNRPLQKAESLGLTKETLLPWSPHSIFHRFPQDFQSEASPLPDRLTRTTRKETMSDDRPRRASRDLSRFSSAPRHCTWPRVTEGPGQAAKKAKLFELHVCFCQPPLINSDGLQPNSDGFQPNSNGLQPSSDGLQPNSDGFQPNSDGLQPNSDGLQPKWRNKFMRIHMGIPSVCLVCRCPEGLNCDIWLIVQKPHSCLNQVL